MSLHPIDKNGGYTEEQLEKFLVFCLLDRAMPYEKVCKAFNYLDWLQLDTRKGLGSLSEKEIALHLKKAGMRFYNQTGKFLYLFAHNHIDLRNASREQLVANVPGLGYKLASMFLRNTRGENYAVIDVHVRRWLAARGIKNSNYKKLEEAFLVEAKKLGMNAYELDMKIWQENRIGNRKKQ